MQTKPVHHSMYKKSMRIYSLIFVLTLFSCSAKYHYNKAIKKGLQVTKTSDTIRISTIDSIPVIKHDTIVYERIISSKDTHSVLQEYYSASNKVRNTNRI